VEKSGLGTSSRRAKRYKKKSQRAEDLQVSWVRVYIEGRNCGRIINERYRQIHRTTGLSRADARVYVTIKEVEEAGEL
jgi:hypothetical protein